MPETISIHKILIWGGAVLILIIPAFLPASWFGITSQATDAHVVLDLEKLRKASELSDDVDKNGTPDWKDLLTQQEATSTPILDDATLAALNDPNNITTSFSKNAYTISAYLKQNDISDPQAQKALIEKALLDETSKLGSKTYTMQDVKEIPDTKTSERAYGNAITQAVTAALKKGDPYDELRSLRDYQETKKVSYIATIRNKQAVVKKLRDTLLAMGVPTSAIGYHVTALNRVEAYVSILDNMSMIETDPLRATLAVNMYTETMQQAFAALNQFIQYFDAQNIVFTTKEPGYLFTSGILPK